MPETRRLLWTICALVALAVLLPAQRLRFLNETDTPDLRWVAVTVPHDPGAPAIATVQPLNWVAVRSRHLGTKATLYHVLARMDGAEEVDGTLQPLPEFVLRAFDALPFLASPAVADEPRALVPHLHIDGAEIPAIGLRLVESNHARQVWRHDLVGHGFVGVAWVHVYALQDVVDVTLLVSWNDRTDPAWTKPVQLVEWRFGEAVASRYAVAEGFECAGTRLRWKVPETRHGHVLGDAEFVRFRARLLCAVAPPEDVEAVDADAIADAAPGAIERPQPEPDPLPATNPVGRIAAVCLDWQGRWGLFGAIPIPPIDADAEREQQAERFAHTLSTPSDVFRVERMYAHARPPSQAGDQPVFGHVHGEIAVNGDPRQIERMVFSAGDDFLRPEHLRDETGGYVGLHNYPELWTWNMRPHHAKSRTEGERCKPQGASWPPSFSLGDDKEAGRKGRDNQHWASVVPWTYWLDGGYEFDYLMRGWAHLWWTNNHVRHGDTGVGREAGRMARIFTAVYASLDGPERALMQDLVEKWVLDVSGDMLRDGDLVHAGKLTTSDMRGIVDPKGKPRDTVNAPFQTIGAAGLYAAALHLPSGTLAQKTALADATAIARTCVMHYAFEEDGRWWLPYVIHARPGGKAIPLAERVSGSWEVASAPADGGSDWLTGWGYRGVPLALALCDTDGRERARAILDTLPERPRNWQDSRWWATR